MFDQTSQYLKKIVDQPIKCLSTFVKVLKYIFDQTSQCLSTFLANTSSVEVASFGATSSEETVINRIWIHKFANTPFYLLLQVSLNLIANYTDFQTTDKPNFGDKGSGHI